MKTLDEIQLFEQKGLTDEWKRLGLKEGQQFATLTDIITKTWSGKTTKEYKTLDRKSTRLNSSHRNTSRMPSSA